MRVGGPHPAVRTSVQRKVSSDRHLRQARDRELGRKQTPPRPRALRRRPDSLRGYRPAISTTNSGSARIASRSGSFFIQPKFS